MFHQNESLVDRKTATFSQLFHQLLMVILLRNWRQVTSKQTQVYDRLGKNHDFWWEWEKFKKAQKWQANFSIGTKTAWILTKSVLFLTFNNCVGVKISNNNVKFYSVARKNRNYSCKNFDVLSTSFFKCCKISKN